MAGVGVSFADLLPGRIPVKFIEGSGGEGCGFVLGDGGGIAGAGVGGGAPENHFGAVMDGGVGGLGIGLGGTGGGGFVGAVEGGVARGAGEEWNPTLRSGDIALKGCGGGPAMGPTALGRR